MIEPGSRDNTFPMTSPPSRRRNMASRIHSQMSLSIIDGQGCKDVGTIQSTRLLTILTMNNNRKVFSIEREREGRNERIIVSKT